MKQRLEVVLKRSVGNCPEKLPISTQFHLQLNSTIVEKERYILRHITLLQTYFRQVYENKWKGRYQFLVDYFHFCKN